MKTNRSYLFAPAISTKLMEKALNSEADCVIYDLEDAVAINEKQEARDRAKYFLQNIQPSKEVYIRINDITTQYWNEDLEAAIVAGAAGVIVPKAESASNMQVICQAALTQLEKLNRDVQSFSVIPLIETAKGVHFAFEIASSHALIPRLAFGSIDYSLDIDCQLTEEGVELIYARSQIVNASRAAGIGSPIDAVYPNLGNEGGLMDEAVRARKIGFKAKLAIHPKQLKSIHEVFTPDQKELDEALEIVQAFESAEQQGVASISVGNNLVDYPVYKKAKSLLQNTSL
jgi:citrate lyase subunit beta/citryl-CoA lyase